MTYKDAGFDGIGVNLAAFWHYWVKKNDRSWSQAVLPLLGAAVCLYIWASLRWQAKAVGGVWLMTTLTTDALPVALMQTAAARRAWPRLRPRAAGAAEFC